MIQKVVLNSSERGIVVHSIEEEIITKKKEYIPESEFTGPTTELFFHELENRSMSRDSAMSKFAGFLLYVMYLITLPAIWGCLKLSGVQNVITSYNVNGLNGYSFELDHYNIGLEQCEENNDEKVNRIQKFLFKTGFYKLPQSRHLLRGEMSLKGPEPLKNQIAQVYVRKYTDFYKRYAVMPGFITPTSYFVMETNDFSPAKKLKTELRYLISNTKR